MGRVDVVRVHHSGRRREGNRYRRVRCEVCGRDAWQRVVGFFRGTDGGWRQELRCEGCEVLWSQAALPVECYRLDVACCTLEVSFD